jgi:photosystem II stability/assembly factor-like uncharacterized protein
MCTRAERRVIACRAATGMVILSLGSASDALLSCNRRHWRNTVKAAAVIVCLLSCRLCLAQATSSSGHGGREVGETPDFALRRAQAFHDMYATRRENQQLLEARRTFLSRAPGQAAKIGRPLPLSFPDRDPNAHLRLLNELLPSRMSSASSSSLAPSAAGFGAAPTWRILGPTNLAGRVSAIATDPSNPKTIYRGTAGGGLWKSIDGGISWTPLTDGMGNLSVGAVAVALSDPNFVYVGTGEGAMSIDGIDGIGLISSSDAGRTWRRPDSVAAARYFALSVHPKHPKEILAATSGGIQKSTDGGVTWTTKLPQYFGTAIARLPRIPSKIIATLWDYGYGKSGSGFIYLSTDDGETWSKVGGAGVAPFDGNVGRMALGVSPSDPTRVYVLAASASGDSEHCDGNQVDQVGFYASVDGGSTWTFRSNPVTGTCEDGFTSILGGQGWYANSLLVSITDPNVLYAGGLNLWTSTDGAVTWKQDSDWSADPGGDQYVHADIHALAWNGTRMLIGNDGGVTVTNDGAASFTTMNTGIVTRQYYSIAVSPQNPNFIIGGAQDNGTNIRINATTTYAELIGGDGFAVAVNPNDPLIIYGSIYDSRIFKSTDGGGTFNEITPGFPQCKLDPPKYPPCQTLPFISPLTMDLSHPSTLYTASNILWKTTDEGNSWAPTSTMDLGDGSSVGYVTKIAVSRANPKFILTAAGSGTVNKSADGGVNWVRLNGLPDDTYASHVEFDPTNVDVFFVSYMGGVANKRLFKTTDGGKSFVAIESGLPAFPVHVVRINPCDSNDLYAGTDVGLYRSSDGGMHWMSYGQGLPMVGVWDIAIAPTGKTLRIASHGRGFIELSTNSVASCH